jgi:hypothetical protein
MLCRALCCVLCRAGHTPTGAQQGAAECCAGGGVRDTVLPGCAASSDTQVFPQGRQDHGTGLGECVLGGWCVVEGVSVCCILPAGVGTRLLLLGQVAHSPGGQAAAAHLRQSR